MSAARHHLIVTPGDGPALTPAQRRFNQLLQKIDKARALLQAWEEQGRLFAVGYAERVGPLRAELQGVQAQLVRRLEALLAERAARWSKADRRYLQEDLCDFAAALIDSDADEALQAEMRAVFERHAGHGFDEEKADEMAAMKGMFEAVSGLDLGDELPQSEEALLRAAQQTMAAQQEEHAQQRARRKPTQAERRRQREQAEATQSLREIYRKLAAALHPDRAEDEADRVRRNALMPRVNQAYEAGDLLALFALQLEIEQVDAAHLARATAARAQQYNRLLAEQLAQLEAEIEGQRVRLCLDHGLHPQLRLTPAALGKLLQQEVAEHRSMLAEMRLDLKRLQDPAQARAFLRARWREAQADHLFDDDLFDDGRLF